MSEDIRLVQPAQEDFRQIAHLVVGGLAARLELTYEDLEDLQIGLEALLGCRDDEGEIVITIGVEPGGLRATVGPFSEGQIAELHGDSSALGLRRVLETVSDGIEVEQRDDGSWVLLTKRTTAAVEKAAG